MSLQVVQQQREEVKPFSPPRPRPASGRSLEEVQEVQRAIGANARSAPNSPSKRLANRVERLTFDSKTEHAQKFIGLVQQSLGAKTQRRKKKAEAVPVAPRCLDMASEAKLHVEGASIPLSSKPITHSSWVERIFKRNGVYYTWFYHINGELEKAGKDKITWGVYRTFFAKYISFMQSLDTQSLDEFVLRYASDKYRDAHTLHREIMADLKSFGFEGAEDMDVCFWSGIRAREYLASQQDKKTDERVPLCSIQWKLWDLVMKAEKSEGTYHVSHMMPVIISSMLAETAGTNKPESKAKNLTIHYYLGYPEARQDAGNAYSSGEYAVISHREDVAHYMIHIWNSEKSEWEAPFDAKNPLNKERLDHLFISRRYRNKSTVGPSVLGERQEILTIGGLKELAKVWKGLSEQSTNPQGSV